MWEILQDKTDTFYKYTERKKRNRIYRLKEIRETYRSTPTYMHRLDPDSNKSIIKNVGDNQGYLDTEWIYDDINEYLLSLDAIIALDATKE